MGFDCTRLQNQDWQIFYSFYYIIYLIIHSVSEPAQVIQARFLVATNLLKEALLDKQQQEASLELLQIHRLKVVSSEETLMDKTRQLDLQVFLEEIIVASQNQHLVLQHQEVAYLVVLLLVVGLLSLIPIQEDKLQVCSVQIQQEVLRHLFLEQALPTINL